MDPFVVITFTSLALVLGAILLLGLNARERFVSELLSRRDNERLAAQLEIEAGEVPQMLASANAYRRAKGMPEVQIEHFARKAVHQQQALIRQAEKHIAGAASRNRAGRRPV